MECDTDPVSPVCGPNWKTYRSMCHAIECGGFRVDDVKLGKCESLVGTFKPKNSAFVFKLTDSRSVTAESKTNITRAVTFVWVIP